MDQHSAHRSLTPAVLAAALALGLGCGGGDDGSVSPGKGDAELAFFATSGGSYRLGTARADGRGERTIAGPSRGSGPTPHLFSRPAWSPDGSQIAFAAAAGGRPQDERADVYVIRADGSEPRRLTTSRDAFEPTWSRDGRTVLFTRVREVAGEQAGGLWAVRTDASGLRRVSKEVRGRIDHGASVAPDGRRVAFTRTRCRRSCGLRTDAVFEMHGDGSGQRLLIAAAADPAFSPDGERLAYVSTRDRNGSLTYGDRTRVAQELYVASADGRSARRLTRTRDRNEARPTWAPGGTRIAVQRGERIDNAEGMTIHQLNPDGSCEREILADPRLDTWYASPAWRPAEDVPARLSC